jgi:hypothetical protein
MSFLRGREAPIVLTAFTAIIVIFAYYIVHPVVAETSNLLTLTGSTILSFSIILATLDMLIRYGKLVMKREKGWIEGCIPLLIITVVMFGLGVFMGTASEGFLWIQNNIYMPGRQAFFSCLIFYIGSACWRAFRARSIDSALLLVTGIITMLAYAPVGTYYIPWIKPISDFLADVPATAATTAIKMTIAIGGLSMGVRIILGIERSHLG